MNPAATPTLTVAPLTAPPKPGVVMVVAGSAPAMALLLVLATVVAFALARRRRPGAPMWLSYALELVPVGWAFVFALTLVHAVSDLIPARKHPPFFNNAVVSAGLMAFAAALVPRRVRGQAVGVMGLVVTFLALGDMLHMRIFGNVLPVGSHGSILQLWDVRSSIASLLERRDLWLLAYAGAAAAMLARFGALGSVVPGESRSDRLLAYAVPVLALSGVLVAVGVDVVGFLGSKWAREVLNREDQVWNAGFLEAHVREIALNTKHALERRAPTQPELEQVDAYYQKEHAEHETSGRPSFGQFKGKNLLVIQIEAFEEWLVGARIGDQEVTPFLNRLREQGVYYPNIFNEVATTPTADCEYLVLNSNHPLPDGAVAFRREDNHFVTLATTLRDAGYSTVSMHGYRKGMWNRAVLHPRYGFTHSLFADELGTKPEVGWGLDDHVLFDDVALQVQKERAPWFVYAITLSSHHPYNAIPLDRRRLKLGPLEASMVGNYMHSAAFVDDALAGLFEKLGASGVLRDTIVVLYGDHDGHLHASPGLREALASMSNLPRSKTDFIGAGGAADALDKTDTSRFWVRNRIPLLVLLPCQDKPQVARVVGGQIDFAPTILHYLGIEPPGSFLGHAILPGDVGGFVARWDGSFTAPPLVYEAGLDECRVLSDLRPLPADECRPLAERARRELDVSWRVTNNDLAQRLVAGGLPAAHDVAPAPSHGVPLGGACEAESDCAGPSGYDVHCLRGLCVTDPHGHCEAPGASAPCPLGSACYPLSRDLDVCTATCDSFACAGTCDDGGRCAPRR